MIDETLLKVAAQIYVARLSDYVNGGWSENDLMDECIKTAKKLIEKCKQPNSTSL